jgi:hypothetical protein
MPSSGPMALAIGGAIFLASPGAMNMTKEPRARPGSAAMTHLVALSLLACGAEPRDLSQVHVHEIPMDAAAARLRSSSRPPPTDAGATPVGSSSSSEQRLIEGCVVHAGEIRQSSTRVKRRNGTLDRAESSGGCSMDAECVQRQGHATPGDRTVAIDCKGKTCTCTLQELMPRSRPRRFRLALDSPCASIERVQSLLLDRCVRETKTADQSPKGDSHSR